MKSSITVTLSKIIALIVLIMGFILTWKMNDSVYFITVVPISTALIMGKQYWDKNKKQE